MISSFTSLSLDFLVTEPIKICVIGFALATMNKTSCSEFLGVSDDETQEPNSGDGDSVPASDAKVGALELESKDDVPEDTEAAIGSIENSQDDDVPPVVYGGDRRSSKVAPGVAETPMPRLVSNLNE